MHQRTDPLGITLAIATVTTATVIPTMETETTTIAIATTGTITATQDHHGVQTIREAEQMHYAILREL